MKQDSKEVNYRGWPKKRAPCPLYVTYPLFIIRLPLFCRTWQNQRPWVHQDPSGTVLNLTTRQARLRKTQDSIMRQFECEKTPSKSRIQNWVDHFAENLIAASDNRSNHSGRPKKRTAELVESVRESLQESLKRSKRSQSLGMSRETCRRVLVSDIRAYPCRIQTLQTLTVSDKKQRSTMLEKTP